MALRWFDGFETYGASGATGSALNTALRRHYDYADTTDGVPDGTIADGRDGGLCLNWNDFDSEMYLQKSFPATDTVIIGFAFRVPYEYENSYVVALQRGTNTNVASLRTNGYKSLWAYFGSTSQRAVPYRFAARQWYYIEWKVYIHPTAGTSEIRINGQTVQTLTGLDTDTGYLASKVKLYSFGNDGSFDDLYICDGSGTEFNDFLGPQQIQTIRPTSDDTANWDASDVVSHYELINENPTDGDASYLYSDTLGTQDLFGYSDVSLDTINAVRVVTTARIDGSAWNLVQVCDTGTEATEHVAISSTSYGVSEWIMLSDPDGSSWTTTTLNAAKFGFKVG